MRQLTILMVLLASVGSFAATITVDDDGPADYTTIQAAIDTAVDGDTVIVSPGTYAENIHFGGIDIVLTSTDPTDPNVVGSTIIDGKDSGSVVTFAGTETSACVLSGFTIRNGNAENGGGIHGKNGDLYENNKSNASISYCLIIGNTASGYYGGGIYACDGSITDCTITNNFSATSGGGVDRCNGSISNCLIMDNSTGYRGGGLAYCNGTISNCSITDNFSNYYGGGLHSCDGTISHCTIMRNETVEYSGGGLEECDGVISNCIITNNTSGRHGGGLSDCQADINNCMIADNSAVYRGGGLYNCDQVLRNCTITNNTADNVMDGCGGSIDNCIIWGNNAPEVLSADTSVPDHSCYPGGTGTNIDLDPNFVDPASDYHLSPDSLCMDAGDPAYIPNQYEEDIDGEFRVMGVAIDMGADEVTSSLPPIIGYAPGSFLFRVNQDELDPASQILMINNSGYGTLEWSVADDCDWLTLSPVDGQATTETDEIELSVDVTGLALGIYTGQITLSAEGASNNPVTIPMTLYIRPVDGNLYVSSDYNTIQDAINVALPGDSVIIEPGVYTGTGNRDIDFLGKAITVQSINPTDPNVVANTVIDCQGSEADPHRGFNFHCGEGHDSVLDGLTIMNGYAESYIMNDTGGGAIYCNDSSPVISRCNIFNNTASGPGGGCIGCAYLSDPGGGGIYCVESNTKIVNCTFVGNSVASRLSHGFFGPYGGCGAAILCRIEEGYLPEIIHCTFYDNTAGSLGSAVFGHLNPVKVSNCIFWENTSTNYPSYYVDVISYKPGPFEGATQLDSYADYCLFEGLEPRIVGQGNIVDDPMFADPSLGDFHLLPFSPAIDAGDPNYIPSGLADIDGQPRLMGSSVDIGVDEWPYEGLFLYVSPVELNFILSYGEPNPSPKTFNVYAFGDEILNWQISEDCPWLTVNPSSGVNVEDGEPNEVEVLVDVFGLTPGQYDYTLEVIDPNAENPGYVDVSLRVLGPVIETSVNQLSFSALLDGPNPPDQSFTISNSGFSTLNWQISETCSWLSVSPDSGSLTNNSNTVTVSVDITGLAGGSYNCDLLITDPLAENNPQTVSVSLNVIPPIIGLSTNTMNFTALLDGPNPTDQNFLITNTGGGTLNWQISETCSWLSISQDSGNCGPGISADVVVSVDITGLVEGSYNCDLTITDPLAENNPQTVSVNLSITPPIIDLSTNTMNFSALLDGLNPADQTFSITNTGGGTLNWQIDETCSWLTVSPTSGSCDPDVTEDVTVSVDTSGLVSGGVYVCEVTVSDPLAENSPQTVSVNLNLQGPILDVSSTTFNFAADLGGADPNDQTLTITNTGGGTLNWSADTAGMPSWLTIAPTSGGLANAQSENATLSITLAGLTENIYSHSFEVAAPSANGSPKNILVNLNYGNNCYGGPDYSEWITVGKPDSWCWPMQCHGDADGDMEAIGKCMTRIGFNDLDIMLEGFNNTYSGDPLIDTWIAADFDHHAEKIGKGFYRVGYNDIDVLLSWFNTSGVPEDCQTASPVSP